MKISAVVLTKNSQNTLEKALQSLSFADEIVIIDDFSSDNTLKIVKKHGLKIFKRKLVDNFAAQRNFALSKTKNNHVLFLDSDEYLSGKLIKSIKTANFSEFDGFRIKRKDIWLGKKLKGGEWSNQKLLRLADKTKGKFKRSVHEYWDIKGKIGELEGNIIHDSNTNLNNFINKLNIYSKLHAGEKTNSSLLNIIFKPIFKFIFNFVLRKGFHDGTHGFVYAILMSFHSFLAWSTLWINSKQPTKH